MYRVKASVRKTKKKLFCHPITGNHKHTALLVFSSLASFFPAGAPQVYELKELNSGTNLLGLHCIVDVLVTAHSLSGNFVLQSSNFGTHLPSLAPRAGLQFGQNSFVVCLQLTGLELEVVVQSPLDLRAVECRVSQKRAKAPRVYELAVETVKRKTVNKDCLASLIDGDID